MARAPLLQLSDISLTFGGDPIFDGLDLVVQPGDRVALVGRNGSGKSTLMKVMAGLVEADAGTRVVPPGVVVGYMEQEPDLSAFETLGAFAASGLDEGEEYRVALAAEGLKFDPDTLVSAASGGERRRLELARALATQPKILLLDEPFAGVDPISVDDIRHLVQDLCRRGIGVLVTDHNVRETLEIVDRAYILHDGRVLMSGTADEVVRDENVRRVYLGERFRIL